MPLDLPAQAHGPTIAFDNSYARLPERFFARQRPIPVGDPRLVRVNTPVAALLGIDPAALDADMLAGSRVPAGSTPIAQPYSGHQFGNFSPVLGDGRAVLLGEVLGTDGQRYDIQLKGSGRTAFSRGGDGRAAIGPMLREYIVSEGMHALGIPTTRALAVATTGEPVFRETTLPGAVLTRIAASHLRVGTFQFFAAHSDVEGVHILADYAIARHYPECAGDYPAFLRAVIARQADLVAQWLLVGFIHGVMNTDNVSIAGETIDYGPCAFMDEYDPGTVFSSIDQAGRYAYGNQPRMTGWNPHPARRGPPPPPRPNPGTTRSRSPRPPSPASASASSTPTSPASAARSASSPSSPATTTSLKTSSATCKRATPTGRSPSAPLPTPSTGDPDPARALFNPAAAFDAWATRWHQRLAPEPAPDRAATMRGTNPLYIPRNHLVEAALTAATAGDYAPFEALLDALSDPFTQRPGLDTYALPPRPDERVLATFCGT